jgi:hypothetical protein
MSEVVIEVAEENFREEKTMEKGIEELRVKEIILIALPVLQTLNSLPPLNRECRL